MTLGLVAVMFGHGAGAVVAAEETSATTPQKEPLQGQVDAVKAIHTQPVFSLLKPDAPLRLAVQGGFPEPAPGTQVKLFVASQGVYDGPLSAAAVEEILRARRGDTLEHRLSAAAQADLRAALEDFDLALRDLSLLIDDTEGHIRDELRRRPDRCIVIPNGADDLHPARRQLTAVQAGLDHAAGHNVGGAVRERGPTLHRQMGRMAGPHRGGAATEQPAPWRIE